MSHVPDPLIAGTPEAMKVKRWTFEGDSPTWADGSFMLAKALSESEGWVDIYVKDTNGRVLSDHRGEVCTFRVRGKVEVFMEDAK